MAMEREFIDWLGERLPAQRGLAPGIGDDAAVLELPAMDRCLLAADMLTDGVDFKLAEIDPRRAGRKALAVNLSDLAAMAARPLAALVTLALPRTGALELAKALYEGLIPLAEKYDVAIAGGDTNTYDGPLVVSVTVVGQVAQGGPLLRCGARAGDAILVTGRFGGSRLGHHLDFEPRVREALELAAGWPLRAGIDVSDGLSLDLARLAEASGCGAVVELAAIPVAEAAASWAQRLGDGSTALEHALADGEDFELILAVPPETAAELVASQPLACGLSRIGSFVAERGLWQGDATGRRKPLAPRGFEH
jgi:thiamine-monophosphate kinase